jgi:imidazolonepropionase-like amidohydrolase
MAASHAPGQPWATRGGAAAARGGRPVLASRPVRTTALLVLTAALVGCATQPAAPGPATPTAPPAAPVAELADAPWRAASSEAAGHEPKRPDSPPVLIRGAKILVGDGRVIERGFVLLRGGLIVKVGEGEGAGLEAPEAPSRAAVQVIDGTGKWVTPGIIDTHSHLGVFPLLEARAHLDGNEMTAPVTAAARVVDAFWPQDPGIDRAVAGGVTTIQALPGSGNLIGGRAVTLKLRRAATSREMHFEGAPDGLKMACGENPKRIYGGRQRAPMTRMGNLALQRTAFLDARRLIDEWATWRAGEARRRTEFEREVRKAGAKRADREKAEQRCKAQGQGQGSGKCAAEREKWASEPLDEPLAPEPKPPPRRDLDAETLAGALEGRVLVHVHCYRADDMASMIALADEVGFKIRSFHHALEAYKIRGDLVARGIGVSTWADWWGFKLEAVDGIPESIALLEESKGRPIVHSDSPEGIRRLNQEAAKALFAGQAAGIAIDEGRAMRWLTLNPAWALGIDDRVGSLDEGKQADVVIWDRSPFSVYARPEVVFIDGLERWRSGAAPGSDLEVAP